MKARVETIDADQWDGILGGDRGIVVHGRGGQEQIDTTSTAGTPLKVLDLARMRETALTLVVLADGTTATGIHAGMKVNEMFHLEPDSSGAVRLALCVALGTATCPRRSPEAGHC